MQKITLIIPVNKKVNSVDTEMIAHGYFFFDMELKSTGEGSELISAVIATLPEPEPDSDVNVEELYEQVARRAFIHQATTLFGRETEQTLYEAGEKPSWIIGTTDRYLHKSLKKLASKTTGKNSNDCLKAGLEAVAEHQNNKLVPRQADVTLFNLSFLTASIELEPTIIDLYDAKYEEIGELLEGLFADIVSSAISNAEDYAPFKDHDSYLEKLHECIDQESSIRREFYNYPSLVFNNKYLSDMIRFNLNDAMYVASGTRH